MSSLNDLDKVEEKKESQLSEADLELIRAAIASAVKMTSEKVLRIWQLADVTRIPGLTKSIIWVEKGNNTAGLEHILRHAPDFEKEGVVGGDKLMELAEAATKVGRQGEKGQGKGGGRPIFGLSFHGQPLAVAISVGSNGYVVGMNPSSLEKFLAQNKLDEEALKEFHSWPAVTK